MHNDDLLNVTPGDDAVFGTERTHISGCLLPKSVEALEDRGEWGLIGSKDIDVKTFVFSTSELMQHQTNVECYSLDILKAIQSILSDVQIPAAHFFFRRKGLDEVSYYDNEGMELQGPEVFHGTAWRNIEEKTIPHGGILLGLTMHSDETVSQNRNKYPLRVGVANLSFESMWTDAASRIIGLGPTITVRRKRGTKWAEDLDEEQRRCKNNIQASWLAHVLAELNERAAAGEITFNVRDPVTGVEILMPVHVRVIMYVADQKEKEAVLGLTAGACARCMGPATGIALEMTEGRMNARTRRHFMRTDITSQCGTAKPRTTALVLTEQERILRILRTSKTKKSALQQTLHSAIKFDVETKLQRIVPLFPNEGPYCLFGADFLHAAELGVVHKFDLCIDALLVGYHSREGMIRTPADVRALIDERLSDIPVMPNSLRFRHGWFESNDLSSLNGKECLALHQQLIFCYVTDSKLLPDKEMRERTVNMHCKFISIVRELKTRQFYVESELSHLKQQFLDFNEDAHWLMDRLTEREIQPGDGLNIIKYHEFMDMVSEIKKNGSALNGSSEPYERLMKNLKRQDTRIDRNSDNSDKNLLMRMASIEFDDALGAQNNAATYTKTPTPTRTLGAADVSFTGIVNLVQWRQLTGALQLGSSGPRFTLEECESFPELILSTVARGGPIQRLPFAFEAFIPAIEDDRATFHRLHAGHCVSLDNGALCQVLLPCIKLQSSEERGSDQFMVVVLFQNISSTISTHPDIPMRWVKRISTDVRIVNLRRVTEMEMLVQIPDIEHRQSHDQEPHYLLSDTHKPLYAGGKDRAVYRCCQKSCGGRHQRPGKIGGLTRCDTCEDTINWL